MSNEVNHAPATESEAPDAPVSEGAKPAAVRTDDELARELYEFGKQFPEPEMGCNRGDARWLTEHWAELVRLYRGQFVVVFNGAVVAHGGNAFQLHLDMARKFNVHPDRLTVELVYAPLIF